MNKRIFDKELFTVRSSFGTVTLFSLALPLLFETVMNNLQGTVNTAVLSGYSDAAVAATGTANVVINVLLLIASAIATGATVTVSNAIGAENKEKAGGSAFMAIVVCTGAALMSSSFLIVFSEKILRLMNMEGKILKFGIIYFRIRCGFLFITSAQSVMLALLKCYGYPKYTFIINIFTNICNLLLNIFVIHFPSISPVTGVNGVAWACVISNTAGFVFSAVIFKKLKITATPPSTFKKALKYGKNVLEIGLPSALSGGSFTFASMITTSFTALLGGYALAAKVYYTNILSYVYLFSMSVGNANALLTGRRFGAGEFDKISKMNAQLVRITRAVNLLISLSIIILRVPLLGLFTSDKRIIVASLGVFVTDIIAEQARAISQIYEYSLRACGDVIFSVVILTISCFVFSIGLAYFLAVKLNMGLMGFQIGIAADECTRAAVIYFRYKSGKWKTAYNNN